MAPLASAQPHPRVLFAGKPPEFPWPERLAELKESPPGLALHWAYTGDEASAKACRDALAGLSGDEGYGLSMQGPILYLPLAYDWLYAWRGWTPAERKAVEEKIAVTAESCRAFLDGRDDHVWHTSAPRAAMGLALAGIVLEGHHSKAAAWLAFARDYLEKTYLPALKYLDGAAVAGMSYGVCEGFEPLLVALWALKSAKGVDFFAKEKWLARMLDYILYSLLPDQTFVRWGDIVGGGRCSTRDEVRVAVDMLATAYGSKDGFAESARIDRKWSSHGYHATVLWLAPFFVHKTKEDEIRLPADALFGKDSVGQACFRSGWGDGDTCVFFKCGDYFDDHGHFDQGSFTIWRKGHLAVRSFAYGSFDAPHRKEFGRRTIAHSTLLIGKDDASGCQRIVRSMDAQDLADYLEKKKSKGLETGNVTAWDVQKTHAYLAADLTPAYDPAIVKSATRELVWLAGEFLIVLDRVAADAPARWLLHTAAAPKVTGNVVVEEGSESTLTCVTLLPEKPRIEVVEGWKIDGKDYPPDAAGEFHVPGGHRVEVSGGAVFLHVLTARDAGAPAPAAKRLSGGELGVEVGGLRVTFAKAGTGKIKVEPAR